MNISLVAERYAKALFELALEKGVVEEVYQDSLKITDICENSKELRLLLKSPIINSGKKTDHSPGHFQQGYSCSFHDVYADHGEKKQGGFYPRHCN